MSPKKKAPNLTAPLPNQVYARPEDFLGKEIDLRPMDALVLNGRLMSRGFCLYGVAGTSTRQGKRRYLVDRSAWYRKLAEEEKEVTPDE